MAEFTIEKVSAFPTTGIVADRLYLKKGTTDGSFEIKMSNSAGNALIPLNGGSFVTLTGDQTINGIKRFDDNFILGDPASDYVQWDNTSKTLSVFSQAQLLHKFRGGAAGALNIGQYDVSGNASINNTSNGSLLLGTNNTSRVEIEPDGDVLLKKVDAGTGDTLMIEAGGRIVKSSGGAVSESYSTFIPTLTDAGGGATYNLTTGAFGSIYRVGKFVQIYIGIGISTTTGTPTGNLIIGNIAGGFAINSTPNGNLRNFTGSNQTDLDIALAYIQNVNSPLTQLQLARRIGGILSSVSFTSGNVELVYSFTIA